MSPTPQPILIVDQTHPSSDNIDKYGRTWARAVHINEYEIIGPESSMGLSVGAYVTWVITIQTLRGSEIRICRRYSEFVRLRDKLMAQYPQHSSEIPELPAKSIISRFRDSFLEARRKRLEYFLLCVLLNPVLAVSPLIYEFVQKGE